MPLHAHSGWFVRFRDLNMQRLRSKFNLEVIWDRTDFRGDGPSDGRENSCGCQDVGGATRFWLTSEKLTGVSPGRFSELLET
jgi:hypothetical protein